MLIPSCCKYYVWPNIVFKEAYFSLVISLKK